MTFGKIGPDHQIQQVQVHEANKAETVQDKLKNVPEKLEGNVQGRSISASLGAVMAAVERKINQVASYLSDVPKSLIAKPLINFTTKFPWVVSSSLNRFGSARLLSQAKAGEKESVELSQYHFLRNELKKTLKRYGYGILTKSSEADLATLKQNLENQIAKCRSVQTENKDARRDMERDIRKANIFLESPDLEKTAFLWKGAMSREEILQELGNSNISLFGGDILIDEKVNEHKKAESWNILNQALGIRDKVNQDSYNQVNEKVWELTRFCEHSHKQFSFFVGRNASKDKVITMPVPQEGKLSALEIVQRAHQALPQVRESIAQIKQMQAELKEIQFTANTTNKVTAEMGEIARDYLLIDAAKMQRNLETMERMLQAL